MSHVAPTLAPPGAGLPPVELFLVRRVIFPLGVWRGTWAGAEAAFRADGDRALAIVDALPAAGRSRPVLIRRIAGMEDSSRNWSAAMTLDHLAIVGRGIRGIIDALRAGRRDVPTPGTAAVKPSPDRAPAAVRVDFVALLDDTGGEPTPRRGGATAAHPWFGPLNAFAWHQLLATHQAIHRRQLERIARGLIRSDADGRSTR